MSISFTWTVIIFWFCFRNGDPYQLLNFSFKSFIISFFTRCIWFKIAFSMGLTFWVISMTALLWSWFWAVVDLSRVKKSIFKTNSVNSFKDHWISWTCLLQNNHIPLASMNCFVKSLYKLFWYFNTILKNICSASAFSNI